MRFRFWDLGCDCVTCFLKASWALIRPCLSEAHLSEQDLRDASSSSIFEFRWFHFLFNTYAAKLIPVRERYEHGEWLIEIAYMNECLPEMEMAVTVTVMLTVNHCVSQMLPRITSVPITHFFSCIFVYLYSPFSFLCWLLKSKVESLTS